MSTAKFDTLSNLAGTQSVPVETVAQGSAKAWVNFNGTGTVAIRASFNVSSITDNAPGDYTVNFATAMPDADYSSVGSVGQSVVALFYANLNSAGAIVAPTTSSFRFLVRSPSTGGVDSTFNHVAIFR